MGKINYKYNCRKERLVKMPETKGKYLFILTTFIE